jgi:hypothetical protein
MANWPIYIHGVSAVFLAASLGLAAGPAGSSATSKSTLPFSEVERIVWRYFKNRPDFQPTDLITREDVAPLLAKLRQRGFPLSDAGQAQMLSKIPTKGEFLVSQLSTPSGREFMRCIADYPNGYDRLERLSRLPRGQQTVRDLIRGPGGEKMIGYMATTSGGRELGKMLSDAPNGANFNASTGRIYTAPMLLDRLEQLNAAGTSGQTRAAR